MYDPLRARVEALEKEIILLRQGVQQGTRMRRLWEEAIRDLQEARERLAFCNAQVAIFHRIGAALDEHLALEPFLDKALDVMVNVPGVDHDRPAGIALMDGEGARIAVSRGEGGAVAGAVARYLSGLAREKCAAPDIPPLETRRCVFVPLTSRGQTVGVFYYHALEENGFDALLRETLMTIGRLVGMAVEQARHSRAGSTEGVPNREAG